MTPAELLRHFDEATPWTVEPQWDNELDAYATLQGVTELRQARGEEVVGLKIGLTKAEYWERFGVSGPIVAPIWQGTTHLCAERCAVGISPHLQPKAEPEIAFVLSRVPRPGADIEELFACIDGIAAAIEVVQCRRQDWRPNGFEAIADNGLHAALVVGEVSSPTRFANSAAQLIALIRDAKCCVRVNGSPCVSGDGDVSGSPLLTLQTVAALDIVQGTPLALRPRYVVASGTWTSPIAVQEGNSLDVEFEALGLKVSVNFCARHSLLMEVAASRYSGVENGLRDKG